VFRRRNQVPLWQRLRGWLWPHIGWRRHGLYVLKRLTRMPGTPHSIAAGFACGAAISFTPFMGLHFALSFLLCLVVRGNYIAAAIGTVVGNPWTFPFIWVSTYKLGQYLLGSTPALGRHLDPLTLGTLLENIPALLWPMIVGSIPIAVVAWLAFYFPLAWLVAVFQETRRRRRERRQGRGKFAMRTTSASPDTRLS
jgi:uncharacterized protein (DUF2062 family)